MLLCFKLEQYTPRLKQQLDKGINENMVRKGCTLCMVMEKVRGQQRWYKEYLEYRLYSNIHYFNSISTRHGVTWYAINGHVVLWSYFMFCHVHVICLTKCAMVNMTARTLLSQLILFL